VGKRQRAKAGEGPQKKKMVVLPPRRISCQIGTVLLTFFCHFLWFGLCHPLSVANSKKKCQGCDEMKPISRVCFKTFQLAGIFLYFSALFSFAFFP